MSNFLTGGDTGSKLALLFSALGSYGQPQLMGNTLNLLSAFRNLDKENRRDYLSQQAITTLTQPSYKSTGGTISNQLFGSAPQGDVEVPMAERNLLAGNMAMQANPEAVTNGIVQQSLLSARLGSLPPDVRAKVAPLIALDPTGKTAAEALAKGMGDGKRIQIKLPDGTVRGVTQQQLDDLDKSGTPYQLASDVAGEPKLPEGMTLQGGKAVLVPGAVTGAANMAGAKAAAEAQYRGIEVTGKDGRKYMVPASVLGNSALVSGGLPTSGSPIQGPLNDKFMAQLDDSYKNAVTAQDTIRQTQILGDILKRGITTGVGADYKLGLGRALASSGLTSGEDVANTEAFISQIGKNTLTLVKQLGSGSGISDADREYAANIAGGKITLNEKSIRRILDIQQRAAAGTIDRHNAKYKDFFADDSLPQYQRDSFRVDRPDLTMNLDKKPISVNGSTGIGVGQTGTINGIPVKRTR